MKTKNELKIDFQGNLIDYLKVRSNRPEPLKIELEINTNRLYVVCVYKGFTGS